MIVPAYTFRPVTRSAMVIERLVAESGHSAAVILAHIGSCDYRTRLLAVCKRFVLDRVDTLEWSLNSEWLVRGIGQDVPCYDCRLPCRLAAKSTEEWLKQERTFVLNICRPVDDCQQGTCRARRPPTPDCLD